MLSLLKAHANAVENLVVFAPLVLLANALGVTGTAIAMSAAVYFWARVVHAVCFTFAVPWVRTLSLLIDNALHRQLRLADQREWITAHRNAETWAATREAMYESLVLQPV